VLSGSWISARLGFDYRLDSRVFGLEWRFQVFFLEPPFKAKGKSTLF